VALVPPGRTFVEGAARPPCAFCVRCTHPHPALTVACLFACQLRDWLHVIANSKSSYELRYYNIHDQDADEDED